MKYYFPVEEKKKIIRLWSQVQDFKELTLNF